MFTPLYRAASSPAGGSAKYWHRPASSAWCASSACTPGHPGVPGAGRPADDPPARAHPPGRAPRITRTAAASSHPDWQDPS